MKSEKKSRNPVLFLFRILKGVVIGAGAILPGISGGVLAAVFGIYQPLMELFSAPKKGLKKHWRMLLPIGIGWIAGFVLFADAIAALIGESEVIAQWLFVGLIAGTVPDLLKDASKEGRSKDGYISAVVCFAVMLLLLFLADRGFDGAVEPNLFWFYFCGLLWGISLIIPGMTSSSILMSLDLFEPMARGIGRMSPDVVLPMLAGIVTIVLLLSRVISRAFEKHYRAASFGILGLVIASTVVIIPLHYASFGEFAAGITVGAVGFVLTILLERKLGGMEKKYSA